MKAIVVDQLTKTFEDVTAVDHISFEVPQGELFGLLGPNGAGKTTTINMLSTLLKPTSGRAEVGGYDIILSYADPLTYGIDGLRGTMIGLNSRPIGRDLEILCRFAWRCCSSGRISSKKARVSNQNYLKKCKSDASTCA